MVATAVFCEPTACRLRERSSGRTFYVQLAPNTKVFGERNRAPQSRGHRKSYGATCYEGWFGTDTNTLTDGVVDRP